MSGGVACVRGKNMKSLANCIYDKSLTCRIYKESQLKDSDALDEWIKELKRENSKEDIQITKKYMGKFNILSYQGRKLKLH